MSRRKKKFKAVDQTKWYKQNTKLERPAQWQIEPIVECLANFISFMISLIRQMSEMTLRDNTSTVCLIDCRVVMNIDLQPWFSEKQWAIATGTFDTTGQDKARQVIDSLGHN